METEQSFDQMIEYLHGCYLGRKPEDPADVEQTGEVNNLAAIIAFCRFQERALYPPAPWVLYALERVFSEYLNSNIEGKTHKDYMSLDKCMGLSRKTFRAIDVESKHYELAKRIWLFRWCFGISDREVMIALNKDGYSIEVTGEEAKEPERVYERSEYAQFYDRFERVVSGKGIYDKEETRNLLLSQMSEGARKYIERCMRQRK
jgi:hypothetical protein